MLTAVDNEKMPSPNKPQELRGDFFRSAKAKTELCRHYTTPKGCAFGDKCNYAHGEHELVKDNTEEERTSSMVFSVKQSNRL